MASPTPSRAPGPSEDRPDAVSRVTSFLVQPFPLTLLLIATMSLLSALFPSFSASTGASVIDITPAQAANLPAGVHLIDVREPDEFTGPLGHAPKARLVPLGTLETAARDWPRDMDIVVICRSGGRSSRAAATLSAMGFTRVRNVAGGMLAWNDAKLPVSRR